MSWKKRFNILNAGFAIALLILVLLSILSYRMLNVHIASRDSVDHTYVVLHVSKDILSTIKDAEAGQRGFVITGNEDFLETFYISRDRSEKLFERLKRLTADNPVQVRRCADAELLIAAKFAFMRKTISEMRAGNREAVLAMVNAGEGKQLMDDLKYTFGRLDAEEYRLLQLRRMKTVQTESIVKPLLITGMAVSVLLFILIYSALQKQIRNRIRKEHELYESHEWFSKTLLSIGDGVIATDANYTVSFMNPIAQVLTGWSEEEARGKPIDLVFNVVNEFTRIRVENPLLSAIEEKRIVTLADNSVLIRKDKTEIDIDDSGSPVQDDEGNITGGILIFRDISETRRAEKELGVFFEIMIDLVGVATPGGYFSRINPAVQRILGYTEQEFCEQSFLNFVHPDDLAHTLKGFDQLKGGQGVFNFTNRYRHKNGTFRWLEWNVTPFGNAFYALARDITERQEAQESLKELHHELQKKNTDMIDSISYAQRIQNAFLPAVSGLTELFPDAFVCYRPKDILSGDFYWMCRRDNKVLLAVADCTGHGVPGALLSIIGSQKLSESAIISTEVSDMLSYLNQGIKATLKQYSSHDGTRDGMDIALCTLEYCTEPETQGQIKLTFAGANRPLWIIRKNKLEVEVIRATKRAIGGLTEDVQHFERKELLLSPGDAFYLFSDGYADQFGGEHGKKLMTKRFREVLINTSNRSMREQGKYLERFIEEWRGVTPQVDDILVIGVRV